MKNKPLDDYYYLSDICKDDLVMVALLLQIPRLNINKSIVEKLENLNLSTLKNDLDFYLDMKEETIKDLCRCLKDKCNDFRNEDLVNMQPTNLLDIIEIKEGFVRWKNL